MQGSCHRTSRYKEQCRGGSSGPRVWQDSFHLAATTEWGPAQVRCQCRGGGSLPAGCAGSRTCQPVETASAPKRARQVAAHFRIRNSRADVVDSIVLPYVACERGLVPVDKRETKSRPRNSVLEGPPVQTRFQMLESNFSPLQQRKVTKCNSCQSRDNYSAAYPVMVRIIGTYRTHGLQFPHTLADRRLGPHGVNASRSGR